MDPLQEIKDRAARGGYFRAENLCKLYNAASPDKRRMTAIERSRFTGSNGRNIHGGNLVTWWNFYLWDGDELVEIWNSRVEGMSRITRQCARILEKYHENNGSISP